MSQPPKKPQPAKRRTDRVVYESSAKKALKRSHPTVPGPGGKQHLYLNAALPRDHRTNEVVAPLQSAVCAEPKRCGHAYTDLMLSGNAVCRECHEQDNADHAAWVQAAYGVNLGATTNRDDMSSVYSVRETSGTAFMQYQPNGVAVRDEFFGPERIAKACALLDDAMIEYVYGVVGEDWFVAITGMSELSATDCETPAIVRGLEAAAKNMRQQRPRHKVESMARRAMWDEVRLIYKRVATKNGTADAREHTFYLVRAMASQGMKQVDIARMFSINQASISRMLA